MLHSFLGKHRLADFSNAQASVAIGAIDVVHLPDETCRGGEACGLFNIWVFPKIVVPQNGWFIMENPIKMDDLGVPLFSETSISQLVYPVTPDVAMESQGLFYDTNPNNAGH